MEQKWFATTIEDAKAWQKLFYLSGPSEIIQVTVKKVALDYFFFQEHLDNIGPAYCASVELLNFVVKGVICYEPKSKSKTNLAPSI